MVVGGSLLLSFFSAAVAVTAAVISAASVLAVAAAAVMAAAVPVAATTAAAMAVAVISPAVAVTKQSKSLFLFGKGLFSCIFELWSVNTFREESSQKLGGIP